MKRKHPLILAGLATVLAVGIGGGVWVLLADREPTRFDPATEILWYNGFKSNH